MWIETTATCYSNQVMQSGQQLPVGYTRTTYMYIASTIYTLSRLCAVIALFVVYSLQNALLTYSHSAVFCATFCSFCHGGVLHVWSHINTHIKCTYTLHASTVNVYVFIYCNFKCPMYIEAFVNVYISLDC